MVSSTKNCFSRFVIAAGLGAVCASAASNAHAASYQISVYEDTFGPAGNIPYQSGIIQKYTTDPDGPVNIPQSAGFQDSAAHNEINGIAGDYKVSAEASNAYGGTAHAYAFGDGGFSGNSNSRNADGIKDPPAGIHRRERNRRVRLSIDRAAVRHPRSGDVLCDSLCQDGRSGLRVR
jgi:hypothetical protein